MGSAYDNAWAPIDAGPMTASVPEPSSLVLLGPGGARLAAWKLRNRRRDAATAMVG